MSRETYVVVTNAEKYTTTFPDKPHGYEGPGLYNKRTGYMMDRPQHEEVCAPFVMRDVPEHQHPGGKWISSRSHQRSENDRHDLLPWEPVKKGRRWSRHNKPELANETFARRRGLKTSDRAKADLHDDLQRKRDGLKPQKLNGVAIGDLKFEPQKGRTA